MAVELGVLVVRPRPGTGLGRVMRTLLLLLLWLATRGSALYFHIGETEKKCFIEEIPDETMVIGTGAGRKGRVWNVTVVLGPGMRDRQLSRAGRRRPRRAQAVAEPMPPRAPLTWARPASLKETTGRSCMTSSGRSTSRPPRGLACLWR